MMNRLVAVSNRLPVVVERRGEEWLLRPGSGGLVTALAPVLRDRGGLWIGWSGTTEEADVTQLLELASSTIGYELIPISLTGEQAAGFYAGFCNETLWPLFHDLQSRCNYAPDHWRTYLEANKRFAEVTVERTRPTDFVWVHDYHLMHLASYVRQAGEERRTAFFLHIPFPPVDILIKLPWRIQILSALLEYDLIGFQTMRDRRNFLQCLLHFWPEIRTRGRGPVVSLDLGGRQVRLGSFPIGIDFREFAELAGSREVAEAAWLLHEKYPEQKIILGVDRLDYTKGIPRRLEAYRLALQRFPDLRGKITLIQIVVPSRAEVPQYQSLKEEIEGLVGRINGEFTAPGWVPIHYLYRGLSRQELLSYYRSAEIALITPLKDGMNLVAKEFCAANVDENGVLILSEFAGAATQLQRWALMVNPNDVEGVSEAIRHGVLMPPEERRVRMRRLRDNVRRNNIFRWVDDFLQAALAKNLRDFPPIEEYRPFVPPDLLFRGVGME